MVASAASHASWSKTSSESYGFLDINKEVTSPFWLDTSRELTWLLNLLQSETQFLKIHHPPSLSFLVSSYDPTMEDFFPAVAAAMETKKLSSMQTYIPISLP